MKARDYAKQYQENPTLDQLAIILTGFLRETAELAEKRHIQSNGAAAAILNEQENKWRTLCRYCPDIPPGLYAGFIEQDDPELYHIWKACGR